MKITAIRIFRLEGELQHPEPFWEERLVRPVDLYPEDRAQGAHGLPAVREGAYPIVAHFVEIETDEGVTGRAGPVSSDQVWMMQHLLGPLLVGEDPIAHERLWDRLYRAAVHGRKGISMMAASALDCALWDLKGRWLGVPVYRLLGGPTRDMIPAYASALGYSLEPARVRERAREIVVQGYRGTKWFFRDTPTGQSVGFWPSSASNLPGVCRTTHGRRQPAVRYLLVQRRPFYLADGFPPEPLKGPVLKGRLASWANRSADCANGQESRNRDGGSFQKSRWRALRHEDRSFLQRNLIKWNQIHQFFLKEPIVPEVGSVRLPTSPGLGMELDQTKIRDQREIALLSSTAG